MGCQEDSPEPTGGGQGGTTASGTGGTGAIGGSGGSGGLVGGSGGSGNNGAGGSIGEGGDAVIVSQGDPDKVLLRGRLITPDQSFDGELLIVGENIACVAEDCSGDPDAAAASVVATNGIIMPGMIDTHNHILFDIMDEDDWVPQEAYTNHDDWPKEARYSAMIDAKQWLNHEYGSPINLNCELNKYGELKGLIAGTTSIVGAANPINKVCYRTLTRTIDHTANGLCGTHPPQSCPDKIQANTLFPTSTSANNICDNFNELKTDSYLIHIGEGTDQEARDELENLRTVTTVDGCLHDPRTVIVHGTAFTAAEFDVMAAAGMGLSWSPSSNVFLYGSGLDLTKTTDIPLALSKGITVALSPDWSMGGSQNLLDELRFADLVDNSEWSNTLAPDFLVAMVTTHAAELLALEDQIGSLQVGMKADVVVLGGDENQPYASVLAATPDKVRLVFVGGDALYGDDQLEPLAPASPGCEAIDICSRDKFVCVATDGGTTSNKWGQTLAEIETALNTELAAYDAQGVTQWSFAPIAPLVKCQ